MDTKSTTAQFHFPLRKMKPRPFLSSGNSNLKRSKSLHCSSSDQAGSIPNQNTNSTQYSQSYNNSSYKAQPQLVTSGQSTQITGLSSTSGSHPQYGRPYNQRRHHSTSTDNYYDCEPEEEFVQPLQLASSSHNLYYQFQNMSIPSPKMALPSTPKFTARASLPTIGNERIVQRSALRKKSQPENLFYFPDPENDSTGSDEAPVWWDDFVLEPLDDSGSLGQATTPPSATHFTSPTCRRLSSVSSNSGPSSPSKSKDKHDKYAEQRCKFYIIRQRNYPPFYLENSGGRIRRRIYRILVLGYPSSGKTSLIEQFCTVLNDNYSSTSAFDPCVNEQLNGRRNLLVHFSETDSFDRYLLQAPVTDYQPDVYLILFSINNRDSFHAVKKTLVDLQRWDDVETKSIIIVANKTDLVRGRCVTRRGKFVDSLLHSRRRLPSFLPASLCK